MTYTNFNFFRTTNQPVTEYIQHNQKKSTTKKLETIFERKKKKNKLQNVVDIKLMKLDFFLPHSLAESTSTYIHIIFERFDIELFIQFYFFFSKLIIQITEFSFFSIFFCVIPYFHFILIIINEKHLLVWERAIDNWQDKFTNN